MLPTVNSMQEAVQRNSFGQFYVKSTDSNILTFYSYLTQVNGDVTFGTFYDTTQCPLLQSPLIGSPEVYWWPAFNLLLARKSDGYDWKSYKFTSNVIGVAQTKANYD